MLLLFNSLEKFTGEDTFMSTKFISSPLAVGGLPSIASRRRVSSCSHAQGVEYPYCVRIDVLRTPDDRDLGQG